MGCPTIVIEFSIAGSVSSTPLLISKVTSESNKAAVGLPGGIISGQESSLHSNGEITTELSVKVQAKSSEKAAVKLIALPLAGSETPVNVCGDTSPTTETDAVPSPERSNVPVLGAPANVTVISAVKVSSEISDAVPLSKHTDSLDEDISVISQITERFPSAEYTAPVTIISIPPCPLALEVFVGKVVTSSSVCETVLTSLGIIL